jgi:hypothetical protein
MTPASIALRMTSRAGHARCLRQSVGSQNVAISGAKAEADGS